MAAATVTASRSRRGGVGALLCERAPRCVCCCGFMLAVGTSSDRTQVCCVGGVRRCV